jgi:hypothetical protein
MNIHEFEQLQQWVPNVSIKQLVITLFWMRNYCTASIINWMFDVSETTVYRWIHFVIEELDNCIQIKNSLLFPDYEERKKFSITLWKYQIALVIDGTEQELMESLSPGIKNTTYSGKKSQHSFTKLIAVLPNGKIAFISKSYVGSLTDNNLTKFPENNLVNNLDENEYIIADQGFQGLFDNYGIISYSTFKNGPFKKDFLEIRSVVENSIAMIKKWRICKDIFRKNFENLEKCRLFHETIWKIVSAFCNLFHETLRKFEEIE